MKQISRHEVNAKELKAYLLPNLLTFKNKSSQFDLSSITIEYHLMCIGLLQQCGEIFVCDMNAATKVDVEATVYLLLGLLFLVRLDDHSVVFVQLFPSLPSFKNGGLIFLKDTLS